jgi:hypothetical protein
MQDAFGVRKSFSAVGGYKAISAMSAAEKAGIKGSHKAAQGMSEADKKITGLMDEHKRLYGDTQANATLTANRKGQPVRQTEIPKFSGKGSLWIPNFPKPGESQRTMARRIAAPKKGSFQRHEMEHATRRKPASAAVRLFSKPEKLWGDEARAESVMKPKYRKQSDYRRLATAKQNGFGVMMFNPSYKAGLKAGGDKKYFDVTNRLKDLRKS